MTENRLPPGYVPLTIHEINAQPVKQGYRGSRPDGERPRRNTNHGGSSKPRGRINNNNNNNINNKRRPARDEDREPNEE